MTQTFSFEMCRLLSSLVPEFEGHWWYDRDGQIMCSQMIPRPPGLGRGLKIHRENGSICPAWQVEDVLRNWSKIVAAVKKNPLPEDHINKYGRGTDVIILTLIQEGDTAYQKIEEYLWSILK